MSKLISIIKLLPTIIGLLKAVLDLIEQYGMQKFISEVDSISKQLKEANDREKRLLVARRASDLINGLREQ